VNGKKIAVKADNKSNGRLKILLELDLDNLPEQLPDALKENRTVY